MDIRQSRSAKVSVVISVALHTIAFFAFAWVRLYAEEDVESAATPVTLIEAQKTKVLRRSAHVRLAASLRHSPQHRPAEQTTNTHLDHGLSSDCYVNDTREQVFSEVKNLGREAVQGSNFHRPSIDFRQQLTKAMEPRESNQEPLQTRLDIAGGYELFGENKLELAKPEVRITTDTNNALRRFFDAVRGRIESKKKYPISARGAGIKGRSGVRITILKNGQLESVEIVDSSGHEILDNAALQSVRNAAPFPPIPDKVGRDKIAMSIYLVFKIT